MPHHVVALALPKVVAFDLSIGAEVFGHEAEDEYTFEVASPSGGRVTTTTAFDIHGTSPLAALSRANTVLVPGYSPSKPLPNDVIAALQEAARRGARVVSICTGAFALAAAGLLDNLSAATHWRDAALLQDAYPLVRVDPDRLYVDHGSVATSAGITAGIDLCLQLVRRDHGAAAAARIARRMVAPPHRAGGQAQYAEPRRVPHVNQSPISQAVQWALKNLDQPLTVPQLARRVGLSERHFYRAFATELGQAPRQWINEQRVVRAQELLETSVLPIAVIAARTGLGSATNLRRQFSRAFAVTPNEYRATFRQT